MHLEECLEKNLCNTFLGLVYNLNDHYDHYLLYWSQVLFRQEGQTNSQVIETQKTSAVVLLPDVGVYIIEVCAVSEGGDGTASPQIRVPSFSGKITLVFERVVITEVFINSIIFYLKKKNILTIL